MILIAVFLLCPAAAFSAESDAGVSARYETIKARYLKLRNTDRNINKESEWLSVIKQLEDFAGSYSASKNAAVALSQSGVMRL